MAFHFRLQKVLDHRQRLVDQQSSRVGEAAAGVAVARGDVDDVDREVAAFLAQGAGTEVLSVVQLTQRRHWLDHLEGRRQTLSVSLEEAEGRLAREREELTRLWRDLEVIKKLRVSKKNDWEAENRRRENQELDEIGQIRADRQKREILASVQADVAGPESFQPAPPAPGPAVSSSPAME